MSISAFLARLISVLDEARIPHMLVGSLASSYHGIPRTTQDIDIVVELETTSVERLLVKLPDEAYYVSREAARDAVARSGMFNVIDLETGWKADLVVRKSRAFSLEEFARRLPARIMGVELYVATAEDTLLTKLEWASHGESDHQLRDVSGILSTHRDDLDLEYIERWVEILQIQEAWSKVTSP